jgi:hypothetical protein
MTRFDAARRAALMRDLTAPWVGRPSDLLPFEEVRDRLHLKQLVDRGIEEVPVDRIVGSLQREREFTREFLPRDEALRERWEEIEEMAEGRRGFPPVELYKVGEAYFVVDGHHRVSVARAVGAPSVEAQVREFLTPVPLGPEASVEDLLLKEGLPDFLEATGLVPQTPDEYRVTEAAGYARLLDHIAVHRYYLGVNGQRHIPWPEAVASWRDTVYRPMVEKIRSSGILADFPHRTETDLYLFVMDHLHNLRQRYRRAPHTTRVIRHFALTHRPGKPGLWERLRRMWERVRSSKSEERGSKS